MRSVLLLTLAASFLCLGGCRTNPSTEIKNVLDKYDALAKDYSTWNLAQAKEHPKDPQWEKLQAKDKELCEAEKRIDASATPDDFRKAFADLVSSDCNGLLKAPDQKITYEGDPETAKYKQTTKAVVDSAEKYGVPWKYPTQ